MKSICIGLFVGVLGCATIQPVSAVEAARAKVEMLHAFGAGTDGQYLYGSLIEVSGILYGTTGFGGTHSLGTVFAIDPKTRAETVLHSFGSGVDGINPLAGLIDVKGTLYGTTSDGGSNDDGTVFALDPATGAETVLHSFGGGADGVRLYGGLIDVKGTLYGTTFLGGAYGLGTVFALDPNTGAEKVLYSFCRKRGCPDGDRPHTGLIDVKGLLYGTTYYGGRSYGGTAFSLDPNTREEKVLYSFCTRRHCTDGEAPVAGLMDVKGILYGTTTEGGNVGCQNSGCGTVFSLDPQTGVETVVYDFCALENCLDGSDPTAGLIHANGTLYGTTFTGGDTGCGGPGCGTVFSLDPGTGAETVIQSFGDSDAGLAPRASLIDVRGTLYGTTYLGGTFDYGTAFALKNP